MPLSSTTVDMSVCQLKTSCNSQCTEAVKVQCRERTTHFEFVRFFILLDTDGRRGPRCSEARPKVWRLGSGAIGRRSILVVGGIQAIGWGLPSEWISKGWHNVEECDD